MIPEPKILDDWKIIIGGRRGGANCTVQNGHKEISGTVVGWLDADGHLCQRRVASFVQIKRWSYGSDTMDIPAVFAVPVDR